MVRLRQIQEKVIRKVHQMKTEFKISLLVVAAVIISLAFQFTESQIELALVIGLAAIAALFNLFRKYKEKKGAA